MVVCMLPRLALSQQPDFNKFSDSFVTGYQLLHIPDLELSYVDGLKHIGTAKEIDKQVSFFSNIKSGLNVYQVNKLTHSQQQDYLQIAYETDLNLNRLTLEKQWLADKPDSIPSNGIFTVPNGKAWYKYLLKKWLSADVSPDQIYKFGLSEVKGVKAHIQELRKATGLSEDFFYRHLNDPQFFTADTVLVQHLFEQARDTVYHNLHKVFNAHTILPLTIKRGADAALAQTPGYYDNNTFYYNLFGKPYNTRQVGWLFIHEGVPGHHYQASVYAEQQHSKVQQLFFYMCYAEGWAAYTEKLGKVLGVYKTPYDELGECEWDIVRAVRVPMDVGLNYYGWTNAQALAFWRQNIHNHDDIALREIARVKRWPVQAITYNYGAAQISGWKQELMKKQGRSFDIKKFHDRILENGPLPLFMVRQSVME